MDLFGRRKIIIDAVEASDENIVQIVRDSYATHLANCGEIEYLWQYYKGNQPILHRKKQFRPEICNRIVENRANEIVSFKVGYLCGEPIQYVGRGADETVTAAVNELNEIMLSCDKAAQDKEIVEWQMICGTAYRLVLPVEGYNSDMDSPISMITLDPRHTFVVYGNEPGNKPICGVTVTTDKNDVKTFRVYSKNMYWKIVNDKIESSAPNGLGTIPIFEYPANNARLGSFEIVIPLLDAINATASNRMDGLEQYIQAFIKFINCDIDKDSFEELKAMGAIKVKSLDGQNADVDIVSQELNQGQTQTLVDYMYQTVLTVCGMPNRNGGKSTSDTGSAVIMRDGWTLAESRAKDSELMFKRSEQGVISLILHICRTNSVLSRDIRPRDIEMKFTRRNYEDIQSKSQVLVSMLQSEKIHPQLAFTHCGMFSDPDGAYLMSKEYADSRAAEQNATQTEEVMNDENIAG